MTADSSQALGIKWADQISGTGLTGAYYAEWKLNIDWTNLANDTVYDAQIPIWNVRTASDGFSYNSLPSYITTTSTGAGWYMISGHVIFSANATGYRTITAYGRGHPQSGISGGPTVIDFRFVSYLPNSQFMGFEVVQNSGGFLDVLAGSTLQVVKLST